MPRASGAWGRRAGAGILVVATLILAACGSVASGRGTTASQNVTLRVFAAASLTGAFGRMGQVFEQEHPGVTVSFNFAGSQTLATQIDQGAPADVFASADAAQMSVAQNAGKVAGTPRIFVHNRLVVIYPKSNPAHITTLHDLAKPGLKLDLAASAVPVGQYSLVFLDKASADPAYGPNFKRQVLANVVSYEEDVKVVLAKVQLGEADAGIVYTSDVASLGSAVGQIAIPHALNSIASYPIATVNGSAHAALARAFVAMVLSAWGQQTLKQYGFIPASAGTSNASADTAATGLIALSPDRRNG